MSAASASCSARPSSAPSHSTCRRRSAAGRRHGDEKARHTCCCSARNGMKRSRCLRCTSSRAHFTAPQQRTSSWHSASQPRLTQPTPHKQAAPAWRESWGPVGVAEAGAGAGSTPGSTKPSRQSPHPPPCSPAEGVHVSSTRRVFCGPPPAPSPAASTSSTQACSTSQNPPPWLGPIGPR